MGAMSTVWCQKLALQISRFSTLRTLKTWHPQDGEDDLLDMSK